MKDIKIEIINTTKQIGNLADWLIAIHCQSRIAMYIGLEGVNHASRDAQTNVMRAFSLQHNLNHKPRSKLTLNDRTAHLLKDFSKSTAHFSGNMELTRLFSKTRDAVNLTIVVW